jgi:MFS family permease
MPQLPPFLLPLIFINLTGHMALSGGRLTGSMYVLGSGSAEALVGVFMALFSMIASLTSLAVGRWVDRVGAGHVMKVGIAAVILGAWLPVVWLNLPALFVMAVTVGWGFNTMSVASQHTVGHLVARATPAERLANFGWFAMGHSASSALGPFIAGLIIDHVGFRAAFATIALSSCLAGVLVTTRLHGLPVQALPDTPPEGYEDDETIGLPTKPHVKDLLAGTELRRIYVVSALLTASWDLFMVTVPVLGHRMGFSASVIGTIFSLFAIGTFTARAAMPWLSHRAGEWHILRIALIVIVLTFLIMPWAHLASLHMALGLAFGGAVGMSQPNMLSLIHRSAPAGRGGEAVGLRSVLGNGVSVAVPLLFGAALIPLGLPAILNVGAAIFGMAIIPAHRAVQRLNRPV